MVIDIYLAQYEGDVICVIRIQPNKSSYSVAISVF